MFICCGNDAKQNIDSCVCLLFRCDFFWFLLLFFGFCAVCLIFWYYLFVAPRWFFRRFSSTCKLELHSSTFLNEILWADYSWLRFPQLHGKIANTCSWILIDHLRGVRYEIFQVWCANWILCSHFCSAICRGLWNPYLLIHLDFSSCLFD